MKVLIVLGLLAVSALAVTQADKQAVEGSLKKKLIGGPDSLPFFLRPGYKKPEQKKLIGGPDSLPYFLRPGYKKPETTEQSGLVEDVKVKTKQFGDKVKGHLKNAHAWLKKRLTKKEEVVAAPVVETSGFAQDAKVQAINLKDKVVRKTKEIKDKVIAGAKKAHKWIKEKLAKKETAPVVEQSGFVEETKVKAVNLKDKVVRKSKEIKDKVVAGVKKAHKWIKEKLAKKETAPVVEQSGFVEDAKVKATTLKDKVVRKSKEIKDKVVAGVKKAHKWIKEKLAKKETAPVVEQSGFVEDAKVKATTLKDKVVRKSKELKEKVVAGVKKAHKWIKEKLAKKKEVETAPVVEQSGFSEDASEKLAKAKETASVWWNKFSNKAKEAYGAIKNKINA